MKQLIMTVVLIIFILFVADEYVLNDADGAKSLNNAAEVLVENGYDKMTSDDLFN